MARLETRGFGVGHPSRRTVLAFTTGSLAALFAGTARAADKIKVAAVYVAPVEQQWDSRLHKALRAAQQRGDIDYVYSESVAMTDQERVIREYASAGQQLIVSDSFSNEESFRAMAKDYPDTKFLMGSSFGPQDKNYAVFDNYIQDASYLTGLIAGGVTKSGVIGMVGGYPIPEVNRLMNAFKAGVRETRPDAKFLVTFIGSWFDPPKAKEAAFAQIDSGADVLYAERFGVTDAAKERKVLAIGNVINTQPDYPDTMVASAIWNAEPMIDAAVAKIRDGTFTGESYEPYASLKAGGSELAPLGTFEDKLPSELLKQVRKREEEIRSGAFKVTRDDSEVKP
jgi:basic membrane lipoprotein Med (substrate-binding protein (PBP1-ABC) superfamily)